MASTAALVGPAPDRYAASARAAAHAILHAPPFVVPRRPPGAVERAFDDVGRAIGDAVRWVFEQLRRYVAHPIDRGLHATVGGWTDVVLVAVVGALVALASLWWLRHRSRPGRHVDTTAPPASRRAVDLLGLATAARREGDYDRALRLRFEAGLERLEDRGVLGPRRALTTSAVAHTLGSPAFDSLATTHTLVAYAGVHASASDVEEAFERWPQVAEGAAAGVTR